MIVTTRFLLRELTEADVTQKYCDWLNDESVNRFLEVRHTHQTLESCTEFVTQMSCSPDNILLGIFTPQDDHVGNVRLGPINSLYHSAYIGLVIGEGNWTGKGVATEVIQAVTDYGFIKLNLNKIEAGCYEHNLGSKRAFEKVGYSVEGFQKSRVIDRGKLVGTWNLGLTKEDWKE